MDNVHGNGARNPPFRATTFSEWFRGANPQHVPLLTQERTHPRTRIYAFNIRECTRKGDALAVKFRTLSLSKTATEISWRVAFQVKLRARFRSFHFREEGVDRMREGGVFKVFEWKKKKKEKTISTARGCGVLSKALWDLAKLYPLSLLYDSWWRFCLLLTKPVKWRGLRVGPMGGFWWWTPSLRSIKGCL